MSLVVTNTAQLAAAVRSAAAGDTILMASGHYDWLQLTGVNFSSQVTIASEDPTHRAEIQGLNIASSSGLTFKNLNVDIYGLQNSGVNMAGDSNVILDGLKIFGLPVANGVGPGIVLGTSNHIQILNSDISGFGAGISNINNDTVLISGNTIHNVTGDGIDTAGTSNVKIIGNQFTDFHTEPGAHADAIQFYTTFTSGSAHDITITGNVFTRGDGELAQGIFMGNEWNIQYKNVLIADNAIVGGMFNGIYVENADHVTIDHNLVDGYSDEVSWIYLHGATNSTVENNSSTVFKIADANPGLVTANNSIVGQTVVGDISNLHLFQAGSAFGTAVAAPSTTAPPTTTTPPSTTAPSTGVGSGASAQTQVAGETLTSNAMDATLQGGGGNDSIVATAAHTYLRGGDGDDQIVGGSGFDDINGNAGNDTVSAGAGADWVLGGQGNDKLLAGDGDDLVYGNLGSDTLDGGAGADTIRGGQADDMVTGGSGNDWLSGDLGSDTMTGGAGADIFHTFTGTGVDVVTDFNAAEGDRVLLDPGTTYTATQSGADVVIMLGTAGDEMILQGIKLASLNTGWIFSV